MLNSPSFKKEFVQSVSRWMCVCVCAQGKCGERTRTFIIFFLLLLLLLLWIFANQFEKMHAYNRLIISSDGFAIILKTSIINFFHVLHCFISYSERARSSACFFVGVSSFISFCCYCFRVSRRKKGQNVITHILLRHEWFTHIQSTNKKTHLHTSECNLK